MVQTHSGRMAACLSGSVSLFFSPPSSAGTSRLANHNKVGTEFAVPSLRCTQMLFHVFSFLFPHYLFILVFPFFFFRMEILRSTGVACSGQFRAQSSRARDGRRVRERSRRGNLDIYQAMRELQNGSHVFFISAGV